MLKTENRLQREKKTKAIYNKVVEKPGKGELRAHPFSFLLRILDGDGDECDDKADDAV